MRPGNLISRYKQLRTLGQAFSQYDGGPGPFFKYNHGCMVYGAVNWAELAHNEAKVANEAYNKASNKIQAAANKLNVMNSPQVPQLQNELRAIQQKIETDKGQILHDEPYQSYNCPDPGWYTGFAPRFEQYAGEADNLLSKIALIEAQSQAKPEPKPTPEVVTAAQMVRPPLALPFTGSCPKTHFKATDAKGDFCSPCPPGQIFGQGKCQPKPPPCPCDLPRAGDPDFGTCPKPPAGCGPPPQHQKCNVPGYGPKDLICKCGRWQCPTTKDLLIEKFKKEGKAVPAGLQGFGAGDRKVNILLLGVILVGIFMYLRTIHKATIF